MMWNKSTITLASSLTAVPLAIMLVAVVLHKRRRTSSRTSGFITQTRSIKQNANTMTGTDRQQLKRKSQRQQSVPWQESMTMTVMATTNASDNPKDATPAVTPPLMVSSNAFDNTVTVTSSS